jgi:hypothetical protein
MIFQLWLRTLLNDAVAGNKAHIVALLGPHDLRQFYLEGTPPSIESISRDGEAKVAPSPESIRTEPKAARRVA